MQLVGDLRVCQRSATTRVCNSVVKPRSSTHPTATFRLGMDFIPVGTDLIPVGMALIPVGMAAFQPEWRWFRPEWSPFRSGNPIFRPENSPFRSRNSISGPEYRTFQSENKSHRLGITILTTFAVRRRLGGWVCRWKMPQFDPAYLFYGPPGGDGVGAGVGFGLGFGAGELCP